MFKTVIATIATAFAFVDGHVHRIHNDLESTLREANNPEHDLILAN